MQPRRPTMPDVARLAGVSIKTVSRVINAEPTVSDETVDRVRSAVKELGFRRNDMARSLRSGRVSASIGLVIEDLGNPFYSSMARAVEAVARQHGSLLMVGSSEEDPDRERELVGALLERRVHALAIVTAGGDSRYLLPEISMGTPVVFLDRRPLGIAGDSVTVDNRRGASEGVRHLIDAGHRRIAVLGDPPAVPTARERVEGFRAAMASARIKVDERLVRLGSHTAEEAEVVAASLVEDVNPPTAYFLLNNRMTVGVVRTLWQKGVSVPIVGFDDFELADLLPLPVTVIAQDPAEMGRRGAHLLFDRLGGSRKRRQHIVLPTRLIQRGAVTTTQQVPSSR